MTQKTPPKTKTTAVFVDAVEDGRARLLLGDDAFTVPAALLPDDAGEGAGCSCRRPSRRRRRIRTRSAGSWAATIPADRSSYEWRVARSLGRRVAIR